jgi:NAD(P)-dependent dehydrogenase (short-subunit alcohol dehydrogenase family)
MEGIMENIVITGVSTGIGYETARYLVDRGFHVFGSVRKQSDTDRLKSDFGERFTPLLFDVTDVERIKKAASQVKAIIGSKRIKALINNAGIAVLGPLLHLSIEEFRKQLDVNVVGVFSVTQAFLPLLGTDNKTLQSSSRIINISSVSGKIAYPFFGAYAASKHALEAMSDSLRRELKLYDIDVILIEPGNTFTPIIDKSRDQLNRFQETDYASIFENATSILEHRLKSAMSVEVISRIIYKAITQKKPKVRYPLPNKWMSGWFLPRLLPARIIDDISAKTFGIFKN